MIYNVKSITPPIIVSRINSISSLFSVIIKLVKNLHIVIICHVRWKPRTG